MYSEVRTSFKTTMKRAKACPGMQGKLNRRRTRASMLVTYIVHMGSHEQGAGGCVRLRAPPSATGSRQGSSHDVAPRLPRIICQLLSVPQQRLQAQAAAQLHAKLEHAIKVPVLAAGHAGARARQLTWQGAQGLGRGQQTG